MKYKALISDLDGTLIPNGPHGMPSQKVIDTINKAKDKIHISLATGRAPWLAKPILDVLQLSGPVVLLNGALIIDSVTRKPIYERPMLEEDFKTVMSILRKTTLPFLIADKDNVFKHDDVETSQTPLTIYLEDITDAQANILIREFSHIPTLALNKMRGWRDESTVGLNIAHALATKQQGIYELAKLLGIESHEIIGVGDGPNDFPLLMACGLKVAMGNAIPDLKAIADHVTGSVEEDGVAQLIEEYVLKA